MMGRTAVVKMLVTTVTRIKMRMTNQRQPEAVQPQLRVTSDRVELIISKTKNTHKPLAFGEELGGSAAGPDCRVAAVKEPGSALPMHHGCLQY
jgi:hypothetical protein